MAAKYSAGETVYLIENGVKIKEAEILKVAGGFCTIRFADGAGTRVRESRLYPTKEEAEHELPKRAPIRNWWA